MKEKDFALNEKIKQLARISSPYIPRILGRAPYSASLWVLKSRLTVDPRLGKPLLWVRHSYLTPAFKPLVSDLDLTVWYERPPSHAQIQAFHQFIGRMRTYLPFLGEINFYTAAEVLEYGPFLNQFELKRDPELHRRLPAMRQNPADLRTQAATFILRLLEADSKNLINAPELRVEKWQEHLKSIDEDLGSDFSGSIGHPKFLIGQLIDIVGYDLLSLKGNTLSEFIQVMRRHILQSANGVALGNLDPSLMGWSLYPHRYRFAYADNPPTEVPFELRGLHLQQFGWEIWGLMSQYRNANDLHGFESHLRFLCSHFEKQGSDPSIQNNSPNVKVTEAMKRLIASISNLSSVRTENEAP